MILSAGGAPWGTGGSEVLAAEGVGLSRLCHVLASVSPHVKWASNNCPYLTGVVVKVRGRSQQ